VPVLELSLVDSLDSSSGVLLEHWLEPHGVTLVLKSVDESVGSWEAGSARQLDFSSVDESERG
jgi:hypothetical protein